MLYTVRVHIQGFVQHDPMEKKLACQVEKNILFYLFIYNEEGFYSLSVSK